MWDVQPPFGLAYEAAASSFVNAHGLSTLVRAPRALELTCNCTCFQQKTGWVTRWMTRYGRRSNSRTPISPKHIVIV